VQEGGQVYANSLALRPWVWIQPAARAVPRRPGVSQPPWALYDAMLKTTPAQRDQNLTDFMHELNSVGLRRLQSGPVELFWRACGQGSAAATPVDHGLPSQRPCLGHKAAALIEKAKPNQFWQYASSAG
jgi:hypothetical protein